MAYSYSQLFKEVTGRDFENRSVFDPPRLTPLRKPVSQLTVGFSSVAERNCRKILRLAKRKTFLFASFIATRPSRDSSFRIKPECESGLLKI